jgi:hypothetical protein
MSLAFVGIAWLGWVGIPFGFTRVPDWLLRVGVGIVVASGVGSVALAGSAVRQLAAHAYAALVRRFLGNQVSQQSIASISKREQYEDDVVVDLHAFFGDINETKRAEAIAPKLKGIFRDHWKGVLDEGLAKGNSPCLTAFILAIVYYQMILKDLPNDERAAMRQCILEHRGANDERPAILFKIELTTAVARGVATNELGAEMLVRGLGDIHRAIFGGDEHFMETVRYFFDGSDRIKAAVKSMPS